MKKLITVLFISLLMAAAGRFPKPALAQSSCSYDAVAYIKDESGNFLNQPSWRAANNKQIEAGHPGGYFLGGKVEYHNPNQTFPMGGYNQRDLATVTLFYDKANWGIVRTECQDAPGATPSCPSFFSGQTGIISGMKIDCGVNISYGWVLRPGRQGCLSSGEGISIQQGLVEEGSKIMLCQGATFNLNSPIYFSHNNQEIYTEGYPVESNRKALLKIASPNRLTTSESLTMALQGLDKSGIKIKNIRVDGARPTYGYIHPDLGGKPLVLIGGNASNQVIDFIESFEPRGWSSLLVYEGSQKNCTNATITNSTFGPAGGNFPEVADGISLSCRNSRVEGNTIIDATDGGIVIFQAPGSLISNNTITTLSRRLQGAIAMVDYQPFGGDFTGTRVTNNIIRASGGQINVGIAMGPTVWWCNAPDKYQTVRGGYVADNVLIGRYFIYGYVVNGVRDWTATNNRIEQAIFSGQPSQSCSNIPNSPPTAFLKYSPSSQGIFQSEFQEGYVENTSNIPRVFPSFCPYHAVAYIKDEAGNFLNESFRAANNKQIEAGNPGAVFVSGRIEYHNDNITFPFGGYNQGDLASVKLFYDSSNFNIVRTECRSFGATAACPSPFPGQPTDTIADMKIDCNVDVQYGWILKQGIKNLLLDFYKTASVFDLNFDGIVNGIDFGKMLILSR